MSGGNPPPQERLALRLVKRRQLWRVGLDALFELAPVQAVAQQFDLHFQINDVAFMGLQHLPAFLV